MYVSPVGDDLTENPSEMYLRRILERDSSYWHDRTGNGFGALEYIAIDDESPDGFVRDHLSLTKDDKAGVFLSLSVCMDDDELFATHYAINETQPRDQWIDLHHAGEPYALPAILFHPIERIAAAAAEFCSLEYRALNSLPPSLNWIDDDAFELNTSERTFNSLTIQACNHNYGEPDDARESPSKAH
ncbi:hypothetical protein CKO51_20730 [Rhodopirellula sp. SM50]|nr:hypothetical protein CKO51_20730 [Rhodopirellula sp. SM50]